MTSLTLNKSKYLDISGESDFPIENEIFLNAFEAFCSIAQLNGNVEASLVFCNSREMQRINKRFRGVDKTTDVLSFPAEQKAMVNLTDFEEVNFIGEILIDTNYVMEQTGKDRYKDELVEVFVHGLLHLIGYDHQNISQTEEMNLIKSEIIRNITRDGKSE
jgi:probable rRNA maturation factor